MLKLSLNFESSCTIQIWSYKIKFDLLKTFSLTKMHSKYISLLISFSTLAIKEPQTSQIKLLAKISNNIVGRQNINFSCFTQRMTKNCANYMMLHYLWDALFLFIFVILSPFLESFSLSEGNRNYENRKYCCIFCKLHQQEK